jgi:two-component system sensor histidine kinase BarA
MYLLDPFILVSNSISNQVLSECITFKESIKTNISEKFKKEPLKDYILLLAEDNDLNRKIIEERLISFGALVISCPDGDAALELYKARTYDAILMDAHMPKISGTKLTEIIRRDFSDSKTPIIGITASTSTVEYQHFIHSGMSDCLIKPLQDKRLIETILKYAAPESIVSLHDVNKITTAQSSSKDLQLSTQDRIDAMSIDSIKAHILELQQVMKISLPKEKQIALFNELHKMNGTLSMTSFKDLQVKTSEIESLVNPMLLEQDEKTESLLIRQIVLAEEKLLELIPELELKIA